MDDRNHAKAGTGLSGICREFADQAMEYNDLPGLVIGVLRGEEEVICARGVRDVLTGDPLRPGDIFHCASVSKLFTATAVMKLVEADIISLDDRLCDILPGLLADNRWQDIRIWQMLSHTAGIGDVRDYRWQDCLTAESALSDYVHSREVTDQPLLYSPGEGGFRYSNVAYEILGHIVAVGSGRYRAWLGEGEDAGNLSYEEFVRRYLMAPAGMKDSTMLTFERFGTKAGEAAPLITEEIRRRNASPGEDPGWQPMALPHAKAEDRSIVPLRYYPYTRSHGPSSTLTSNAADLLQWARAHRSGLAAAADRTKPAGGRESGAPRAAKGLAAGQQTRQPQQSLLSPGSYQQMKQVCAEVPNNRETMGLGWFMRRQGGYQLYGHEGTDDGFRASLWICPEADLSIVVLSNLSGAPVKKLNKKLFDRLMDAGIRQG